MNNFYFNNPSRLTMSCSKHGRKGKVWLANFLAIIAMMLFTQVSANAATVTLATECTINGTKGSWTNTVAAQANGITFTAAGNDTYTLDINSFEMTDNGTNQGSNELRFRVAVNDNGIMWDQICPSTSPYTLTSTPYTIDDNSYAKSDRSGNYFTTNIESGKTYKITVVLTQGSRSIKIEESSASEYVYQTSGSNNWISFSSNNIVLSGSQLPVKFKQTATGKTFYSSSEDFSFSSSTNTTDYTLDANNATAYGYDNASSNRYYYFQLTAGTDGGSITMSQLSNGTRVFVRVSGSSDVTPHIWAWNGANNLSATTSDGKWPGDAMTKITLNGETWYAWSAPDNITSFNFIINNGNQSASGNKSLTFSANGESVFYVYNGNTYAEKTTNPAIGSKSGLSASGTSNVSSLYMVANFNGSWSGRAMKSYSDNRVWALEVNSSELPTGTLYFRLPYSNTEASTSGLAASSNGVMVPVNDSEDNLGRPATAGTVSENAGNFTFANESNMYNKYYIEAIHVSDDEGWRVTVTTDGTVKDHYEISYDGGETWSWLNLNSNNQATIYKAGFQLRYVTTDGTKFFKSDNEALSSTESTYSYFTPSTDTEKATATKYTFADTNDNGFGWLVTINSTNSTLKAEYYNSNGGYWLYIKPEGADDKDAVAYWMNPSRARNGGVVSKEMFTKNLKSDRIRKDLRQKQTDNGETPSFEYGNNVVSYVYTDGTNGTTSNKVNGSNITQAISAKSSYTWYWDNKTDDPSQESLRWRVVANTGSTSNTTDAFYDKEDTYYLIGNFESASHTVDINPANKANLTKLTRYVYKGGIGYPTSDYTSTDADVDSIVYRASVPRPAEGWGELYLAVTKKSLLFGKNTDGSYNDDDLIWNGENWNTAIRPQVQTYNRDGDNNGYNGVDGTALEGGLFKGTGNMGTKTGWPCIDDKNRNEALNPLVSAHADATSYIFSMNVTYHTYRIVFNDAAKDNNMYLVGPAVCVNKTMHEFDSSDTKTYSEGKGNGTETSGENSAANWMGDGIKLKYFADEQCYKFVDAQDQEKPIYMNPGESFRFVTGKDFTNPWYGEDDVTPKSIKSLYSDYNLADGQTYGSKINNDTQFLNYLNPVPSSPENKIYDAKQSITFGLNNRTSNTANYIRLYVKHIDGQTLAFYTVSRKVVFNKFDKAYDLTEQSGHNFQYWRSFSDFNACRIPTGVHVYIVNSVDELPADDTSSQIGKATITDITSLGYIPANCGVLLGKADQYWDDDYHRVYMQVYDENPNAVLPPSYGTNMLQPAITSGQQYVEGMYPFNYLRGHAGFYHPIDGLTTTNNDCYLSYTAASAAKKGAQGKLAFSFGDIVKEATTGISSVETVDNDNAPYYTISGLKLDKRPTAAGIYIHNGRKVVVK